MNGGWSLRRRLLAALALLAATLFGVSAVQNYLAYRTASNRLFDDSLRETAGLLMQLAQHEVGEHGRILGIELLRTETKPGPYEFRFQIWTPDMQSGYLSSGGQTPLVPFDTEGFAMTRVDGEIWRAFSLWDSTHTMQVQIAQRHEQRLAQQRQSLLRLVMDFLLLVVVATIMIWWIVGMSIRPLADTAISVGSRSEQDLSPVDVHSAPGEVRPLLDALNRLLGKISAALWAERRFTSDAAHELRTPLAAIRANAQVLAGARSVEEQQRTTRDLLASVDRGTRLVDQLLALARADQATGSMQFRSIDLAEVVAEQIEQHHALAERLGVKLSGKLDVAMLSGDPGLLAIMVRNLLDNALRYTQAGGLVRVEVAATKRGVEIAVADDGPGIPVAERQKVFERFRRIAGSPSTGSGLGLSIVQRIVEQHGGGITIEDGVDGRGTTFRVIVPAAGSGLHDDGGNEAAEAG